MEAETREDRENSPQGKAVRATQLLMGLSMQAMAATRALVQLAAMDGKPGEIARAGIAEMHRYSDRDRPDDMRNALDILLCTPKK